MPFAPAALRGLMTLPAPAPAAPAAPSRRPVRALGPYVLSVVLSLAVLIPGQRLTVADLDAPFAYSDDALLILPLAKATVERGSHWRNERLGFPGIQEGHDFPVVDHLHFAGIWLIGQFTTPVRAFNLFHLLTYPLAALAGVAVLRRLGVSGTAALCGGLLFAFLPFHYRRGENHYFLSAYFVVPFTVLIAVWAADAAAFATRRRGIATAVIAVLTASAGAYYAFFGCALLAAAALYAVAAKGSLRAAGGAAAALGLVFAAGVANHAPAIAYQAEFGRNSAPHTRGPAEAETFGLKVVQLLLPTLDHRSKVLDDVRKTYDTPDRPLLNENESANLGLVGAVGFLGLLAAAVLPFRKTSPVGPAAGLLVAAVLVGTVGGFGAAFAQFVSPQVRSYNRISIYIAFLSLFAAVWALDRLVQSRPWLRPVLFGAVAALGVWDQTPKTWFTAKADDDRKATAARWRADAAFFATVEAANPDATVLCLPYAPWPEDRYEHLRGYLHTAALTWSHGAMKGRDADVWLRRVCTAPAEAMLTDALLRGFDGLLYDPRLCDPWHPAPTLAAVQSAVGAAPILTHPDGTAYFDLRPARDKLKAAIGPAGFDAEARKRAGAVTVLWLDGFRSFEPTGQEDRKRWCDTRGEIWFVNPTPRERLITVTATLAVTDAAFAAVILDGKVWSDRVTATPAGVRVQKEMLLPPGRHRVAVTVRPSADATPHWPGERLRVLDVSAAEAGQ